MWKLSSENKKCNLKSEAALNSVRRTKKSDCDLNPSERGSKHGSKKYNCQRISFLSQHICSSYFLLDIFLVFCYLLEISNLASFLSRFLDNISRLLLLSTFELENKFRRNLCRWKRIYGQHFSQKVSWNKWEMINSWLTNMYSWKVRPKGGKMIGLRIRIKSQQKSPSLTRFFSG